jgi:large subunit ribosomal protein L9
MQVLLIKNVDGLGRTGDIKEVAGGYAHNFLFARKLAVPVTDGAIKQAEITKEADKRRKERKVNEAKTLASMIDGRTVVFSAGRQGDRLYGSITNADIADKLGHTIGQDVDRRFIEIEHQSRRWESIALPSRPGRGHSDGFRPRRTIRRSLTARQDILLSHWLGNLFHGHPGRFAYAWRLRDACFLTYPRPERGSLVAHLETILKVPIIR